MKYIIY
jgi:hypothetical protein